MSEYAASRQAEAVTAVRNADRTAAVAELFEQYGATDVRFFPTLSEASDYATADERIADEHGYHDGPAYLHPNCPLCQPNTVCEVCGSHLVTDGVAKWCPENRRHDA